MSNKRMTETEREFAITMLNALEEDRYDLHQEIDALTLKIDRWKRALSEDA